MNTNILISEHQIKNKHDTVLRALQNRFPLDQINVNEIIFDPSKTEVVGQDDFKCTFYYKGEVLQIQPGPLYFDQVTSHADNKIRSWHNRDLVLKVIDDICRIARVAKQNVVVKKSDEVGMLVPNVQMPNTFKRSLVKTMTLCIDSRRFKIEYHDDWQKIIEVDEKTKTKTLLSFKYTEGVKICPKSVVNASYEVVKNAVQDAFPFRVFSDTTITSSTPRKNADNSWSINFYDKTNCQFLVNVTAEGVATCRDAFQTKPPKALLDHIKAAGHTSIRVSRCELKEEGYQISFSPEPLIILRGYRATLTPDGRFECEEVSLGPVWTDA